MSGNIRHFKVRVSGKVQGVFYRASAQDKAEELQLKGFVLNEASGDVYAEVEGSPESVKEFISWCHQGSPRAEVSKVEVSEGEVKDFTKFEIRR